MSHWDAATLFGGAAALIFYGRFYLQWIVSERRGESVMPVGFWYMSVIGSLMLLGYGAYVRSPVGVLSHSFNMVIYTRNLIHIWRAGGTLSKRRAILVQGFAGLIVLAALGMLASTWLREYQLVQETSPEQARQTWFWLFVGVAGQGLFACRFIVQWLVTEAKQKSVIPVAFWWLSVLAASMLLLSHLKRGEWVFVLGVSSTLLIYGRNLWLIYRHKKPIVENAGPTPVEQ
jgi:lipid-A-disaccharide synthase-like uncharacterized protein